MRTFGIANKQIPSDKAVTRLCLQPAQDLASLDVATVRGQWSVLLERTVRELQGTPCIALDNEPPPKQEIACTRSFGHPITDLADLNEVVTHFALENMQARCVLDSAHLCCQLSRTHRS